MVIVNIGNKIDATAQASAGLAVPYVGPDIEESAHRVGKALALKLKKGDAVAIIEADTVFRNSDRRAGFRAAMSEAGLTIAASETVAEEGTHAAAVAMRRLAAHPALRGFLCTSDTLALGVADALQAAGKGDQVKIASFDNRPALDPYLASRKVVVTADTHAENAAINAIEVALKARKEGTPVADVATPVDIIIR